MEFFRKRLGLPVAFSFFLLISFLLEFSAHSQNLSTSQIGEIVAQQASERRIHESREWRKLLHFEPSLTGKLKSQVDGAVFFLSPYGKENLEAEMKSTIQAFFNVVPGTDEMSTPQCRFPARFYFLKNQLKDLEVVWPEPKCPRWEKYFQALRGQSVSLIFSSYYLNNPASSFGHTFLRINKSANKDGKRFELLDYGINYAANLTTSNALVYAFKGLFGFFDGTFTSLPYYYKVREYNDSESRDLWDYSLNLTPAQVDQLVRHLWEMGPTSIDYFYLSENCSYHMLSLLEAANPDLDLLSRLKSDVIPQDTVRIVWDTPDLVTGVKYRPSLRTQLNQRLKEMTEAEKLQLKNLLDSSLLKMKSGKTPTDWTPPAQLSLESKRKIYDAALDYADYKFFAQIQKDSPEKNLKNSLLKLRSQIPLVTPELQIPPPKDGNPHEAHGSRRFSVGPAFRTQNDVQIRLEYKYSLHDLLDPSTGYPDYAQITFGDFALRYDNKQNRIDLDRATLFEVISFSPWKDFFHSPSWRLKFSIDRNKEPDLLNTQSVQLSGGPGMTFTLGSENQWTSYFGVKAHISQALWGDQKSLYSGLGPNLIFRYRLTSQAATLYEFWGRQDFRRSQWWLPEQSLGFHWNFSPEKGMRLMITETPENRSIGLNYVYYH